MLLLTGNAPGAEDIYQGNLAFEIGTENPLVSPSMAGRSNAATGD